MSKSLSKRRKKQIEYLGVAETARRWNRSRERVHTWIREGRIPGVVRETDALGRVLILVPADAERPEPRKRGPKPRGETERHNE